MRQDGRSCKAVIIATTNLSSSSALRYENIDMAGEEMVSLQDDSVDSKTENEDRMVLRRVESMEVMC